MSKGFDLFRDIVNSVVDDRALNYGVWKSVFVSCLITTYRYKYCHTYVCPNCGETETTESWENGGQVYQYIDGLTVDKRKDIKEF